MEHGQVRRQAIAVWRVMRAPQAVEQRLVLAAKLGGDDERRQIST
ncbi:MAG: hypothetical protein ACREBK_00605 [Sphingomicrobium sp.]